MHEGSGMHLPAGDAYSWISINTSVLTAHDRPWMDSHLCLSTGCSHFMASAGAATVPAAALEQPLVPSALIIAGKCQLVFYPTANKEKYHRAAQPSWLPPTQYF